MHMNPDFENQLAAQVQRELNTLGELSAPPALAGRILRTLEQRTASPWYRSAWQDWPLALQGASLVALLAMFGGICFGLGELSHAAQVSPAGQQAGEWFAWLGVLWKTAGVLSEAVVTAFRHLGMGILIGGALALCAAYAACVGLGTACVRLALARR
jgi:hypothetical protein